MARRRSIGSSIPALLVIIVGIIVVVTIWRNKNFLNFGNPVVTGAAAVGDTVQGPNVYPVVGPALTEGIITIRSGGSSFRDNQGYDCSKCARESTWFFNPGGGGDVSIKMGAHGDKGDATSLIQYSTDGQKWRCEGPHMTYSDLPGEGTVNLGSSVVGIKGVSWNVSGGTNHHEIWLNESGDGQSWTLVAQYEGGADGCTEMACPVPDAGTGCQDTLRIDDPSGHSFIRRSIVEITPGTPTGGGSPPPETPTNEEEPGAAGEGGGGTTTPPAEDEEEDEPAEEEPEEEEEDSGDGDDEEPEGTGPGTRSQDPTTRRINQCSGLTGETYRSCVNSAAAQSDRRRRAPLARAMYSAYSFPYLRRSRIRIGNL